MLPADNDIPARGCDKLFELPAKYCVPVTITVATLQFGESMASESEHTEAAMRSESAVSSDHDQKGKWTDDGFS